MIFPIGHQDASVRRLPWVSFALIASCVLAFLFMDTSALDTLPDRMEHLEDAADYWRRHAYLEAEPELRDHVSYDVTPNQRRQYLATLPELAEHLRPHDPEGLALQQAELDRLTALAFGAVSPEEEAVNPYRKWGYVPSSPRLHTLVTHVFVHGGWLHLIGNLFMFLISAPAIEDRWGRGLFSVFFVLAGVFAGLFHGMIEHGSTLPLVGASGAIAGVLGAFLVRLWSTKIRFFYFFMFGLRPIMGTFEAAAWVMLPLWFGNELMQASIWSSMGMEGGVAYWAHVGGFLFGVAAALAVRASKIEERWVHPAIEAQVTSFSANPVIEQAMAAREGGDVGQALDLLQAEWARQPDEDVGLALWDAALACAQPETGAAGLEAAVRSSAKRGDMEVALRHWSELSDHVPTALVDPATLLSFVPVLLGEAQKDRAILALRQAVDPANAGLSPGQAMRTVEMARELDPPSALRAARSALASPDMHEAKKAKLEALVRELQGQGVEERAPDAEPAPPEPETVWDEDGGIRIARFARAKLMEAKPVGLEADSLRLALQDREAGLRFEKIQAVAVAIVADQGPRPILLIDLLANWNEPEAEALKGVRLRSDLFDPRKLLGMDGDARGAFAALVGRLLEASRGVPLPGPEAALGRPFAKYATLAEYQQQVLEVEE